MLKMFEDHHFIHLVNLDLMHAVAMGRCSAGVRAFTFHNVVIKSVEWGSFTVGAAAAHTHARHARCYASLAAAATAADTVKPTSS